MSWDLKGKNSKCCSNISVISHDKEIKCHCSFPLSFSLSILFTLAYPKPIWNNILLMCCWFEGWKKNPTTISMYFFLHRHTVLSFRVHHDYVDALFLQFSSAFIFLSVGFLVVYFPINPRKSKKNSCINIVVGYHSTACRNTSKWTNPVLILFHSLQKAHFLLYLVIFKNTKYIGALEY